MNTATPALSRLEADQRGYRPLTIGYTMPHERWMLDNVIADLQQGDITLAIVPDGYDLAVWRRPSKKTT